MPKSEAPLEKIKIARFREHEQRNFQATSLPMRALRYYRGLAAKYPPHIVWYHVLTRVVASLRNRLGTKLGKKQTESFVAAVPESGFGAAQEALIRDLIARVEKGISLKQPLLFAVRITGGIGDALIVARLVRDLQAELGNDAMFDVYFESHKVVEPFFKSCPGFRNSLNVRLFERSRSHYCFALLANQFITFDNEHINCEILLDKKPEVLNFFSQIERVRTLIDRFISNHPFLDGAFADVAVRKGSRRYTYLHEMLGLTYGGDRLEIEVDQELPSKLGLPAGKYVTIHDGWDGKFKIAGPRPTKAVPKKTWIEIVRNLKATRPDLTIVQLGGETGDHIPGVDVDLKGSLSFMQSAAVLAKAAAHIDAESGLVHLAAALGVRSAVMFGPTNVAWFGYPQNANVPPKECGNCWWSTDTWMDSCPVGHEKPICTSNINALEVVTEALKLVDTPYHEQSLTASSSSNDIAAKLKTAG